jgi:hypothetical protein
VGDSEEYMIVVHGWFAQTCRPAAAFGNAASGVQRPRSDRLSEWILDTMEYNVNGESVQELYSRQL